jgi:hypothetical protein
MCHLYSGKRDPRNSYIVYIRQWQFQHCHTVVKQEHHLEEITCIQIAKLRFPSHTRYHMINFCNKHTLNRNNKHIQSHGWGTGRGKQPVKIIKKM